MTIRRRFLAAALACLAATGCAARTQPATTTPAAPTRATSATAGPTIIQPSASPNAAGSPAAAAAARAQRWTFDADPAGGLPQGTEIFSGTWAVRPEADVPSPPNALCQTGSAEFPAIALGDAAYADVLLVARVKPISGQQDQAAGLIFRVQDKDNYYILRANALEGNVNLYKYQGGRRSDLKDGQAQVGRGQWQELRVEARGTTLRGFLNGQPVVEATDSTFKTAGRIGLWTKSDSVTCFDGVEAQAL